MMIKIITILAAILLLLSVVSLGVALLKPDQPKTFSLQGKVIANVAGSIPHNAEPSSITGKVVLNVIE